MPAHPNPQFVPVAIPQPVTGKRKTRDEVEGKKKKIIRDPNAPKRPASSYLLFQNDVRQSLKAKHPNVPNNELLQIISKLWQEMPKEQKDVRTNTALFHLYCVLISICIALSDTSCFRRNKRRNG